MSDHVDASAQHGVVDSPDAATPAKPSLRVLEPGSLSRATREEDLDNGPLLLGLGESHEDLVIPYPGPDPASQAPGHHRRDETESHYRSLMQPEALTLGSMTLSTISRSGASFSVPTEDVLDTVQSPSISLEDILAAVQSPSMSMEDVLATVPSVLAKLAEHTTARDRNNLLFSSLYEFSWQDSNLCFSREPFEVVKAPADQYFNVNPGSERASSRSNEPTIGSKNRGSPADESLFLDIAGIGGFVEHLSPKLPEDLQAMSGIDLSDPDTKTAITRFVDWMLELLVDDFFRCYAPNGSKKKGVREPQKSTKASGNQSSGNYALNEGPRPDKVSRKRKTLGGDGESEDDGSEGKKRMLSGDGEKKKPRRWACPFAQWNPMEYPECVVGVSSSIKKGPTTIRGLKEHIMKIHVLDYCHRCYVVFTTSDEKAKHQLYCQICPSSAAPLGLVTKEKQNEIFNKDNKGLSPEGEWRRIYKVLFPGEPKCASPYVNKEAYEDLWRAEVHFRYKAPKIMNEEMQKWGFDLTVRNSIMEMTLHGFLPRMFQEYSRRTDKGCFTPAQCESQEFGTIESSQIIVGGTDREITEFDPSHHSFTQYSNETFASQSLCGQYAEEAPVSVTEPPAVYLTREDPDPSAMLGLSKSQDLLSSVVPEDLGSNYEEISRMSTYGNEWDSPYWESRTNGNQLGIMPDTRGWSGNDFLCEQP
ncbi:hypothetical protein FLAG1_10276 [Fusarium langsethiae]|uniref:Uncharacterized protein n=1 Tax=Fusarium langsethiae TaxID=179993 RepID=A0A0N0V550_FUSLA|nr:hypothetical protein FLAG1_10276 [Fusarium langsethiae]GKU05969.1 unnamed protein product [Fusarium langsethiae]